MSGSKSGRKPKVPLTEAQRRLVRENIGLVAVHLKRYVSNLSVPRRDREWEDLFQEGCLGLMRAATDFREDRGIAFAAFALPRIHNAVSRALLRKFSTVYVPKDRGAGCDAGAAPTKAGNESGAPRVQTLSDGLERCLPERRCHNPDATDRETVGERLGGKYERAVRMAGDMISRKTSTRGDRDKLVRILVEERFLVPHEESRRALRQIARDTRSSYARVAQCDKQLGDAVRSSLEADPEFRHLRRRARVDSSGADASLDEELERDLAAASADEFTRRFRQAGAPERAQMLHALMQRSDADIEDVLRDRVSRLSVRTRELLLHETRPLDAHCNPGVKTDAEARASQPRTR